MTTPVSDDWARLGDEWRAGPLATTTTAIHARLRRRTRQLLAILALEVGITVVALGFLAWGLQRDAGVENLVVSASLLLFTIVIWVLRFRNVRGVLWPKADSLALAVLVEKERLRRRVDETRFTQRVCVVSLPFLVALAVVRVARSGVWSLDVAIVAAACIYLVGWIVWARSARRSRLAILAAYRAEVGAGSTD